MKFALVSVLLLAGSAQARQPPRPRLEDLRMKLRGTPALTFSEGRLALRERATPSQQLNCASGCTPENFVEEARCENEGWDGVNVVWKCYSNVPNDTKLENTTVQCEAFPPGDPEYFLVGSCTLQYSIRSEETAGREEPNVKNISLTAYTMHSNPPENPMSFIFLIVLFVIVPIGIVCTMAESYRRSSYSSKVVMAGYYGGGLAIPSEP